MKQMLKYTFYTCAVMLGLVACSEKIEETPAGDRADNAITLQLSAGQTISSRAEDMADTELEYSLSHIDILIFTHGATDEESELIYHERATATGPSGTHTLRTTRDRFDQNAAYWFYVVANSTASANTFASIATLDALKELVQEDKGIHLTGLGLTNTPNHFLMDGIAYLATANEAATPIVLNNGDPSTKTVSLKVVLRRAAAKVVVKLTPGNSVSFECTMAGASPSYYLRNLSYTTRVINPNEVRRMEALERTTETTSNYFKWNMDPSTNEVTGIEVTAYVYAHKWETNESFQYATNLIVNIPINYTTKVMEDGIEVDQVTPYAKNYYQIPLTKNFSFERNKYYEVRATVNAPGAEEVSEPVEVENLEYSVLDWTEQTIDVGGKEGPEYLKVNRKHLDMYNIDKDLTSLIFSSSSPVTITVIDAYYIDKFDIRQPINNPSIYHISGTTEEGAITGNIAVYGDIPTNNTIRYFTLYITNQSGQYETVTVKQYPLIYIVNKLGWYSYRDDFKRNDTRPTTYQYAGDCISSISLRSWNNTTKKWSYTYGTTGGFFRSKVVRSTYSPTADPDERGRSKSDYYYWEEDTNFRGAGTGEYDLKQSAAEDPSNARMYHVRMTASSPDYKLGKPRQITDPNTDYYYTDPGEDNAQLVSPSFMIASRLGFITSTSLSAASSDDQRISVARDHCAYYVEVANDGTIYDDWRLPTAEELQIIMNLQGTKNVSADAIDYLLNARYYIAASGLVANSKNSTDGWAIRCIRDAY